MVPSGMEVAGSFRSPDRFAPSIMPTTAGKTNEKTCLKSHIVPTVECGFTSHWPLIAGE